MILKSLSGGFAIALYASLAFTSPTHAQTFQAPSRPPCYVIPSIDGASSEFWCENAGIWKVDKAARMPMKAGLSAFVAMDRQTVDLASAGNPNALARLGAMYMMGAGVRRDAPEGVRLIRKAAENGNRYGQFNLAVLAERGDLGAIDVALAIENLQRSASQGFDGAQAYLGYHYLNGFGIPRDIQAAIRWFRAAADQGFTKAYLGLGLVYGYYESSPATFDADLATGWLLKALPISPPKIEQIICVVQAQAAELRKTDAARLTVSIRRRPRRRSDQAAIAFR